MLHSCRPGKKVRTQHCGAEVVVLLEGSLALYAAALPLVWLRNCAFLFYFKASWGIQSPLPLTVSREGQSVTSLTSLSDALMAPWRQPGGERAHRPVPAATGSLWAQATMRVFIVGLPMHPQEPPRLASLSQKVMVLFLNAELVGNLCGLAVRKQKLIIHISGPEGAVVCRVDDASGFQTQNSPGPLDKRIDSVVLGDSCSESSGWPGPGLHAVGWCASFGL